MFSAHEVTLRLSVSTAGCEVAVNALYVSTAAAVATPLYSYTQVTCTQYSDIPLKIETFRHSPYNSDKPVLEKFYIHWF